MVKTVSVTTAPPSSAPTEMPMMVSAGMSVAQRVADDHELLRQTLGEGRPHVVFAQHVEHRGANQPRQQPGGGEPQRERRQEHSLEMARQGPLEWHVTAGG